MAQNVVPFRFFSSLLFVYPNKVLLVVLGLPSQYSRTFSTWQKTTQYRNIASLNLLFEEKLVVQNVSRQI